MLSESRFLFVACQVGAESALKKELAQKWPAFRLAFSRAGFVTFKLPPQLRLADDFQLGSTLARTYGFSVGKVTADSASLAAEQSWQLVQSQSFKHLHVWQRDSALPGDRGFEPGITPLADEVSQVIAAAQPDQATADFKLQINQHARRGDRVLDCVLVEPHEWWIGWHVATEPPSRWPGGVPRLTLGEAPISRAYLKVLEALAWSRLPIKPGEMCAEIGSAPGGAAQALLERGMHVLGIDPAEMDEAVLAHPQFIHIRKRVNEVKRREFRQVKWLLTDSNIAPKNSLDDIEAIVTHREVHIRGLLLTLKLSDWDTLNLIPDFVSRVRSWGFSDISTRQLAFNRREICLAARKRLAAANQES